MAKTLDNILTHAKLKIADYSLIIIINSNQL